MQALKVNPQLHMLVFGESVVNDAVAIVIYRYGRVCFVAALCALCPDGGAVQRSTLEQFTKPGAELGAIAILEASTPYRVAHRCAVADGACARSGRVRADQPRERQHGHCVRARWRTGASMRAPEFIAACLTALGPACSSSSTPT